MKAALFETFGGALEITEVDDPNTPADGVVIEVQVNGICRSDWHAWQGHDPTVTLPHVLGHELAGQVVSVGSKVTRWQTGQRVTVPFCCGCGSCNHCRSGQTQICDQGYQPGFSGWGAYARYLATSNADTNLQTVAYPELLGMIEGGRIDPGCLVQKQVDLATGAEILMSMDQSPPQGVTMITRFE